MITFINFEAFCLLYLVCFFFFFNIVLTFAMFVVWNLVVLSNSPSTIWNFAEEICCMSSQLFQN